jgi:hypothetical protein
VFAVRRVVFFIVRHEVIEVKPSCAVMKLSDERGLRGGGRKNPAMQTAAAPNVAAQALPRPEIANDITKPIVPLGPAWRKRPDLVAARTNIPGDELLEETDSTFGQWYVGAASPDGLCPIVTRQLLRLGKRSQVLRSPQILRLPYYTYIPRRFFPTRRSV